MTVTCTYISHMSRSHLATSEQFLVEKLDLEANRASMPLAFWFYFTFLKPN